jgi:exonuclease SbcC
MIKDIELKDFISHKDTRLDFGKGITIFVGHNGAGKSSIIDALTFALYGKHTRRSNKNLIRRGTGFASVQMNFMLNSKEYQIKRALNTSGPIMSQFELVSDSGKIVNRKIASGERGLSRGEKTSSEVAKVLGLSYEKLCVAAVVQQGELVRIIESSPKEFKELLNSLIGIERLDSAYQTMHEVIQGFRERLRDDTAGYSDEDIGRVEEEIKKSEQKFIESESVLERLDGQRNVLEEKFAALNKEIERMTPLSHMAGELQRAENLIVRHVIDVRDRMDRELVGIERLMAEARRSLEVVKNKSEANMRLRMVRAELEDNQLQMVENEGSIGKLKGFIECAGRLQITDGRCPVCSSPVTKVNKMFDIVHIRKELDLKEEQKKKLQYERLDLKKEEQLLVEQTKQIAAAEKFLQNSGIGSDEDLLKVKLDLEGKKKDLAKLPLQIVKVGEDPSQLVIDATSQSLATEIAVLREKVKGFNHKQYTDTKLERDDTSRKLLDLNKEIGIHQKTKTDAKDQLGQAKQVLKQLQEASEFIGLLENVRSVVFNRDGHVGKSLRSWALKVVSSKASEYIAMFNIGISRIELAEETKEVQVSCYGRHGEIDMDSLSGGEKVAVALALRLGIAYMMGSSRLDFIILDEPTTHLDEERRKALVKIISEAFREGAGPLSQLVIITHDSDIFEDSEVDRVYRFAMTAEGSRVSIE